ncbi:major allergen Pru ar 1-like [Aristolochia californica]|uniref:major allergen Pru ar 1-like n=1 Tax=Aristolochia californica TaxID=171875 RepID=UPI0035D94256
MVVKGFSQDFVSPVSASRMFKAGIVDAHNLVPKLIPGVVTGMTILQGDGALGSVKRTDFTDVIPFSYVTDRIDEQDEEKFVYKYTMLEGGFLGKKYDAANYEVRFEPTGDGGSVCKMTGRYSAHHDSSFTEEDIEIGKQGLMGMYKAVEAYLRQNPDAYI